MLICLNKRKRNKQKSVLRLFVVYLIMTRLLKINYVPGLMGISNNNIILVDYISLLFRVFIYYINLLILLTS